MLIIILFQEGFTESNAFLFFRNVLITFTPEQLGLRALLESTLVLVMGQCFDRFKN